MSGFLNDKIEQASGRDGTVLSSDKAARNVRLIALATGIVIILIGFFFKDPLKFALGVLFGTVIAELLFFQNEKNIEKIVADPENGKNRARLGYLFRLFVRLAAIVLGWLNPYTSFVGTVIGLFTIPAAVYILSIVSSVQLKKAGEKEENKKAGAAENFAEDDKGDTP